MKGRASGQGAEVLLSFLDRFSALLAAGLSVPETWRALAQVNDPAQGTELWTRISAAVLVAHGAGATGASSLELAMAVHARNGVDGLAQQGGRWLITGLSLSEEWGASARATALAIADQIRSEHAHQQEESVTLAAARASIILLAALPVLGVVLSLGTGVGITQWLSQGSVGWIWLGVSAVFWCAGLAWVRLLIRKVRAVAALPASASSEGALPVELGLEFLAVTLASAASTQAALSRLEPATEEGLAHELGQVLELSRSTGAPLAQLLRAQASQCRRARYTRRTVALKRLSVWLVLPMGLCFLPAFMLSTVLPIAAQLWFAIAG